MTISTTINSLLLTFGPLFATYHGFNLKEHRAYGALLFGILAFFLTQIVKFVVIAFLLPILFSQDDFQDDMQDSSYLLAQDILKSLVDIVDLFGLYYLLNQKKMITVSGEPYLKTMAVGLGWAAADLISGNLIKIILLYQTNVMKYEYLIQAVQTNFDLLEILTIASLAAILTKKEASAQGKKIMIVALVLIRQLFPVASKIIRDIFTKNEDSDTLSIDTMLLGIKGGEYNPQLVPCELTWQRINLFLLTLLISLCSFFEWYLLGVTYTQSIGFVLDSDKFKEGDNLQSPLIQSSQTPPYFKIIAFTFGFLLILVRLCSLVYMNILVKGLDQEERRIDNVERKDIQMKFNFFESLFQLTFIIMAVISFATGLYTIMKFNLDLRTLSFVGLDFIASGLLTMMIPSISKQLKDREYEKKLLYSRID